MHACASAGSGRRRAQGSRPNTRTALLECNLYYKDALRERIITIELDDAGKPKEEALAMLKEALQEARAPATSRTTRSTMAA